MARNESLLRKADIALADLTSGGGLLNPEQADTFIRKLIKQPTILRECRVVTMSAPTRKINRIGFTGRIMRAAPSSGNALSSGSRAKPSTDQITLTTNEVICEVRLPYDVVEDNIEHAVSANNEVMNTGPGGLRDTVIQLIAEYAARDVEDFAVNATTTFSTGTADDIAFMSLQNGFVQVGQTSGNIVDMGGDTITKRAFKKGMLGMPVQYLRNRPAMKHYVSVPQEIEFQDTLADRGTPMGDLRLATNTPAMAFGSPVVPVALMPDSVGLFCDPLNLIVGFWRQLSMEFDKDITSRVYIIVLTARLGLQVEQADALVVYQNLGSPPA
jgi:hypothetical protein